MTSGYPPLRTAGPQRPVGHRRRRPAAARRRILGVTVAFSASVLVFAASWVAGAEPGQGSDPQAAIFAVAQLDRVETPQVAEPVAEEPHVAAEPEEASDASEATPEETEPEVPAIPANSGSGKRVVFDQTAQRVWLVDNDDTIDRTYLVSGSRFDNLKPGSYSVQSRSRHATAFDNSGTMEYFLRFATGWREPIGFHSIPKYRDGTPEQTEDQLGTRLSAGCVRQKDSDAKYLWDWAPVGTPVTVVA